MLFNFFGIIFINQSIWVFNLKKMVLLPILILTVFRFDNICKSHEIYNMLSIIVLASYSITGLGVAVSSFHSQTLIEISGFISSILLKIREQIGVGIGIPSKLTISRYG